MAEKMAAPTDAFKAAGGGGNGGGGGGGKGGGGGEGGIEYLDLFSPFLLLLFWPSGSLLILHLRCPVL